MVVVDEGAVENDSPVWFKGTCDDVGCVGRRTLIVRRTEAPFRICFDDHAAEVRDRAVDFVEFLSPPFCNTGIQRSEAIETPQCFRQAGVDRYPELDTPRAKCVSNAGELRNKICIEDMQIGIHIVYAAAVDADRCRQARIFASSPKIGPHGSLFEKY